MGYKFIQTDTVHEISDEERDLAKVHEGHEPSDHLCGGCVHEDPDVCFARRNGLEDPEPTFGTRRVFERGEKDCNCVCHDLIAQCRMSQGCEKNDGRPMYRLEDDADGFSVEMPASIYDTFMQLPDDIREGILNEILSQAKKQHNSKENV